MFSFIFFAEINVPFDSLEARSGISSIIGSINSMESFESKLTTKFSGIIGSMESFEVTVLTDDTCVSLIENPFHFFHINHRYSLNEFFIQMKTYLQSYSIRNLY